MENTANKNFEGAAETVKEYSVNELAELFNISTGVIRTAMSKPVVGEVYVAGSINIKEVRAYLIRRAGGKKEADEILGFDVNDLEIRTGAPKTKFDRVTEDQLEQGVDYILRNYHFETAAKFIGKTEVNGITLWIFLTDKGYKALSNENIHNEHFSIIKA